MLAVVVVVVAMGGGCVGGWCRKRSIWSCEKQENGQWMRWHGGGEDSLPYYAACR